MSTIVIGLLITVYAGIIIYKKVKNIKQGKYCNCGCKDCISSCSGKNMCK